MRRAGFELGIDFGTSHTAAVLRWPDGRAKPLLFDGSPLLPSAVYAEPDGRLVVGRDAVHSARIDPGRFEPNPKRRIDDGSVLLGECEIEVAELIGAVLTRVADEARRTAGSLPGTVTLTCPAAWGAPRRQVLVAASARAGLGAARLVEEPVAAATYFAQVLGLDAALGALVVVYDFGGGTFDVSVVERTTAGFRTLAVDGRDDIGGLDLDDALARHIGAGHRATDAEAWRRLTQPSTVEERRQWRLFRDDVRVVKERLSRNVTAELHVPGLDHDLHVTREEFERLARPLLAETVRLTAAVLRQAGAPRERIAGIFLVGGSSRIPLVDTLVHRALEIAPTVIEQPELVVAEGSILAPHDAPPGGAPAGAPVWAASAAVSGPPVVAPGWPASAAVSGPPVSGQPVVHPSGPPRRQGAATASANRPANRSANGSATASANGSANRSPGRGAGGQAGEGGRSALAAVLVLLLLGALGLVGYRYVIVPMRHGGGSGGPAAGSSPEVPDLLYEGAGGAPVLRDHAGKSAALPAGGEVRTITAVPDGWVLLRARVPGGDDLVAQQVDGGGKVVVEIPSASSVVINPTGTRAAALDVNGTLTAWELRSPDNRRSTQLPGTVRPYGWTGNLVLLRATGTDPLRVFDYWDPLDPAQTAYAYTPGSTPLQVLGDSGDGRSVVAIARDGGGNLCLGTFDVQQGFRLTGALRCDTGLTLTNEGALPVVSPDGRTLLVKKAGVIGVYLAGSADPGRDLRLPSGSVVVRLAWGKDVVYVQTASGGLQRCRFDSGECADFAAGAATGGQGGARVVVRFPVT